MNDDEHKIIGKAAPRSDGPEKTTGKGQYVVDITLPDMLWCKVLRSPYPHAKILSIDISAAEALPGVHAVITGEDFKGKRWGKLIQDEPIIAWDRVMYIGDKVAAVAAEDEDIAENALNLIEIEYEELPSVFTIEESVDSGAPILHPDFNEYEGVAEKLDKPTNIVVNGHWEKGDVVSGMNQADHVIEKTFFTGRTHQLYLEPHNCVVAIDEDKKLQCWVGTKSPLQNRAQIAKLFDLDIEDVIINFAYVGGDFGGKGDIVGVPICYELAKKTGRPVKFSMDYSEELMSMNPRHQSKINVKVGVTTEGKITAWESDLFFNGGAYRAYSPGGNLPGANEVAGPYKIDNTRIDSWQVATNTVPGGFQRGPGEVQGIFAGESMMDVIASELDIDPVEFRLINVVHDGDDTPTGQVFGDIIAEEVIKKAAKVGKMADSRPNNVGRGLAYGHRPQYGGGSQSLITVNEDGTLTARTSVFDPGTGTYTLIQQSVAEEMQVPISSVSVVPFSTDEMFDDLFDFGVGGSRGSMVAPQAAIKATRDVKDNLKRIASEFNGWDQELVEYDSGELINTRTKEKVHMSELVQRSGEPVRGRNFDPEEGLSPVTSFVAQVAEVEVDPDTGQVKVLKITAAHDVGKILNPVGFQGQVEGGMVQAFGHAVMEDLNVDEGGRVSNPSLADYKIPTERDLPTLETVLVQAPSGWGEYNVKAVGEHSNITTAPAIANAIFDAVGERLDTVPVHPEVLYGRLKQGS